MIKRHRAGDLRAFDELVKLLEPLLAGLARQLVPQAIINDALQEAYIRMWRNLYKIDLARPTSIKNFLVTVAVCAFRDQTRVEIRARRKFDPERTDGVTDPEIVDLPPTLRRYFDYIAKHGTIYGAHATLGREIGVDKCTMYRMFRKEAEQFAEGL